jgi:hypothetical protein
MFSFKNSGVIFPSLSIAFGVLVGAAPLYPKTINVAGGGLPNSKLPIVVSESGIRDIQLAQFLENLEVSFFTAGSSNITKWGTSGYSNDSIEIVSKIAAVSALLP